MLSGWAEGVPSHFRGSHVSPVTTLSPEFLLQVISPPPPLFRSISGYWLLITWYISGLRSRYVGQAKKRALKMKGKRRNFGP